MSVSIIVDFSHLKLVFPDAIKPIPSNPADLFWPRQVGINNLILKSNNRKKAVYKVSANNNKKKYYKLSCKKKHMIIAIERQNKNDCHDWVLKRKKWLIKINLEKSFVMNIDMIKNFDYFLIE